MIAAGAPVTVLCELPRWIAWRPERRKGAGKPTKVPYSPNGGWRHAKTDDPRTWGSYNSACEMKGCDGPGLVLTGLPELVVLDLDGCRDPQTGRIEPWALAVCDQAQSCTEVSPSGTGLHVLGVAYGLPPTITSLPRGDGQKLEIFAGGATKYTTVTWERLEQYPGELNDISELVRESLAEAEAEKRKPSPATPQPVPNGAASILERLPNDYSRADWVRLGMAHKAAGGGLADFDAWSAKHASYDPDETARVWDSLKPERISGATLAYEARGHGIEVPPPAPSSEIITLPLLDVAAWEGQPVPPREWIVKDRIVRRNVALISGEGGVGKSVLVMQLAVACVTARDWVGGMPEPGPALYINCEDDERELHYRFAQIASHYQTGFAALKAGGLHPVSLAGRDAVLGAPDRSGIIRPTPLFNALHKKAFELQPVVIGLDTATDLYGANENDRAQVRQFIGLLRRLAIEVDCAVVLVSHPSVGGIASDSGLSGSTGWHNGPRTRLYFKSPPAPSGDEPDSDLRELIVKKSNYGPSGEHVRVRWKDGVFVSLGEPSTIERAAAEQRADDLFLTLLKRFTQQGRRVSDKRGTSYAPAAFAEHPAAAGVGKLELAKAMQRLLDAGKIRVDEDGPPSHKRSRLVLA